MFCYGNPGRLIEIQRFLFEYSPTIVEKMYTILPHLPARTDVNIYEIMIIKKLGNIYEIMII